jgi:membrane protein DedA with SNARE-associated domain
MCGESVSGKTCYSFATELPPERHSSPISAAHHRLTLSVWVGAPTFPFLANREVEYIPMLPVAATTLAHLLGTYGYWAVLIFIAIESMGIPVPGETMLLSAAIYAGTTHHLDIRLVIAAAIAGAILGDNLGFLVGREGGHRLLARHGRYIRLDERKLRLGHFLFNRYGGRVVFFGRFVAVLRMWAAFLAGTYRMRWSRFLLYNAAGGILWATVYGLGGYMFGSRVLAFSGPAGIATAMIGIGALVAGMVVLRRKEAQLQAEADRALPDTAPWLPVEDAA